MPPEGEVGLYPAFEGGQALVFEPLNRGLRDVGEAEVRGRCEKIERLLAQWSTGRKLYGTVAEDILVLKYLHQRYTNYLAWLRWKG